MSTQNGSKKINFAEQNFKKKGHCHCCGKLSHYKSVCRKESQMTNRKANIIQKIIIIRANTQLIKKTGLVTRIISKTMP